MYIFGAIQVYLTLRHKCVASAIDGTGGIWSRIPPPLLFSSLLLAGMAITIACVIQMHGAGESGRESDGDRTIYR